MQPDHQNNYWNHDTDEPKSNEITEMYTPEPIDNESNQNDANNSPTKVAIDNAPIHWAANEYIDNEKNVLWYIALFFVVVAFITLDVLILKSYTFSALVIVMALTIIIFSKRPSRLINYTLSGAQGLYIGEKLYHFSEFKSFGLISEHSQHSIILIPTKRFSPAVYVYFPEEVGEGIVDILGARLPMEKFKTDMIDTIVRKLRL